MSTNSSFSDRDPLERLAAEFLDRRRRGENPSPSDYAERHPDWADQIREFFPALEVMEGLKPGTDDRTGSLDHRARGTGSPHPEQLGDYRILREIGRGGMGLVYEAVQESLGRRVALKILPLHGRIDPVQMERFQLESRSAARLHHTGIVPVYGVGEHGGVHYYAMQYIQGHGLDVILEDLRGLRAGVAAQSPSGVGVGSGDDSGSMAVARSLLTGRFSGLQANRAVGSFTATSADNKTGEKNSASLSPAPTASISSVLSQSTDTGYFRAVARLGIQVANALAHAHGQGVLHRDIKPSNLLLDMDGHVWITDFGLAKVEGSEGPTQTGDIIGTLRYMSPERFEGWSDRRSDLYGLGMTLYELLTLHPAFEAATRAKLIDQVLHDPPLAPRKHDPRVPRDLETIVMKAIAKEPGERYPTAEALSADLENFVSDRPIVARRSSPPERAWRWCRRNPAVAGLLAASAVAALALVGFAVGWIENSRVRASERQAVSAQHAEQQERAKAEAAAQSERRLGYFHSIVLAEREWTANNVRRAEELLEACPADLRGWEWNYLKRLCHGDLRTLRGHTDQVLCVAFSPDGRTIASGSEDDTVRLWDVKTGQNLHILRGHRREIAGVAFSPDGKRLASVGGEVDQPGEVILWEVPAGRRIHTLRGHVGKWSTAAFSPNGKRIATSSGLLNEARVVEIWDVEAEKVIQTLTGHSGEVSSVVFSPDGKQIASTTGSQDLESIDRKPGEVLVWDVASGKVIHHLRGHTDFVIRSAFSPNGTRIASASYDGTTKVWDAQTGQETLTLRGHSHYVNSVAFSPDDRWIATASEDQSVKVWDATTGQNVLTHRGHTDVVSEVVFSPNGEQLVSASYDGTLKFWDVDPGKDVRARSLGPFSGWLTGLAFSPDGKEFAFGNANGSVMIWDAASGHEKEILTISDGNDPAWGVAYSPDGRRLAAAFGNWREEKKSGVVKVWDATTGALEFSLSAQTAVARAVAFSPDGLSIAACGGAVHKPSDVKIWDARNGRERFSLSGHGNGVYGIAFGPDSVLISGPQDGVKRWNAATGLPVWDSHEPHVGFASGVVAVSPDGRQIASGSTDRAVTIREMTTGAIILTLQGHTHQVTGVAYSPDSQRLASISTDKTVKIWDATTGQEVLTLRGHTNGGFAVAFSPDGKRIASTSVDGTVRIWDATPWSGDRDRIALESPRKKP